AADGVDASPNANGIEPPYGAGIMMPPDQEIVEVMSQARPIDESRPPEDLVVCKGPQLGTEIAPQPLLDWHAEADTIDSPCDRLRQIALGQQAQDALALAAADLVAIRQLERELNDPSVDVGNARFDGMGHGIAIGHCQYRPEIAGEDIGQELLVERT